MDKPSDRIALGDELPCTVLKALGGRRFLARSANVPDGWTVELHARKPADIRLNSHTNYWVARINPLKKEVQVRDGDFGRLPISPAMLPRYSAAMSALVGRTDLTPEALADMRTMLSRGLKQDQADWATVQKLLGDPSVRSIQAGLERLTEIREKLKAGEDPAESLQSFRQGWAERLEAALEELAA